jgi:hypothetical protein
MLPFLEKKQISGSIMSQHGKRDLQTNGEIDLSGAPHGAKAASQDILRAIQSNSPHDLMRAMHSFYKHIDSIEEAYEDESDDKPKDKFSVGD